MRRMGPLLWSLYLLWMVVGIAWLFASDNLAYYLHPRMWGALGIGLGFLALLWLASLGNWGREEGISWGHVLFLLPLLLGLLVPPQMLGLEIVSRKGIAGIFHGVGGTCTHDHHGERMVLAHLEGDKLIVTEDNFLAVLGDIWEHSAEFKGVEIEITGFVYSDDSVGPNHFVIARLIMSCCAADAEVGGLLCQYAERSRLTDGQWVRVRGVLGQLPFYNLYEHRQQLLPYIEVVEIIEVDKPEREYIYP